MHSRLHSLSQGEPWHQERGQSFVHVFKSQSMRSYFKKNKDVSDICTLSYLTNNQYKLTSVAHLSAAWTSWVVQVIKLTLPFCFKSHFNSFSVEIREMHSLLRPEVILLIESVESFSSKEDDSFFFSTSSPLLFSFRYILCSSFLEKLKREE